MKKLFTFVASALVAMSANAQEVGLFDYSTAYADGQSISTDNASLTLGNDMKGWKVAATKVAEDGYLAAFGKTVTVSTDDGDKEQFSVITVTGSNNPKDQATAGGGSGVNYSDGKTSGRLPQNGTYYILKTEKSGKVQVGIVLNVDKEFYVVDATEATTDEDGYINIPLPEANLHNYVIKDATGAEVSTTAASKGGVTVADKVTGVIEFDVVAGHTYYYFCSGSKLGTYGYVFTPSGDDTPQVGDVEIWKAADYNLENATLETLTNGIYEGGTAEGPDTSKPGTLLTSTITASTANVTMVGLSTPNGDHTPTSPAEAWQLKGTVDGNDALIVDNCDPQYAQYLMGQGNPGFIHWEFDEETENGTSHRVYDTYWEPGNDMPAKGNYWKFTTKVDGALKLAIYGNKNANPTYIVDENTRQPLDPATVQVGIFYQNTGFAFEGNAEEGTAKYFNEGAMAADYVLQHTNGVTQNRPVLGYITFQAKANKNYYVFNPKSQIGLYGFSFVPGSEVAIQTMEVAPVYNGRVYNLQGQVVGADYKGIVIKNGKKYLQK